MTTKIDYKSPSKDVPTILYTEPVFYEMYDPADLIHHTIGNITFQSGPVPENGMNGATIEALLTICKHRLETFQSGNFPCMENDVAINHIRQAISILNQRTEDRMIRQVEGKEEA